jgi:serine/threonine protein kinase/Tfp pilus assembly protein PilV
MQGVPAEGTPTAESPLVVGRYAIYDAIAAGGMATVHLGRLIGPVGFLRTVAVKRLHAHLAHDADFVSMFLDEARLAARIQHPNVVSTLDVVLAGSELLLVMEYVRGESLSRLSKRARDLGQRLPPRVVVAILSGALHGLHAAHEALDEKGQALSLVHRDITPQNILVGADGVARVLDFGIAKAAGRVHTTKEGDIKGKVLYMPPEQLAAEGVDRRADIYAAGVVLFEALTGIRMFAGDNEHASITKIIKNDIRVPSELDPELAPFDAVVRRAVAGDPAARYPTARDMATALDAVMPPASPSDVAEWVQWLANETLDARARIVAEIERSSTRSKPPLPPSASDPAIPISQQQVQAHIQAQMQAQLQAQAVAATPASLQMPATPSSQRAIPPPPLSDPQIAVAAPPAAPLPARRSTALIVALLVLLVGCAGLIGFLLANRESPKAAAAPTPAATASDTASDNVKIATTSRPVVASEPAPPPTTTAAATATATATATTTATATAAPHVVAAPPKAQARPAVNCDPPYVVDKQGHRHFIPECVK